MWIRVSLEKSRSVTGEEAPCFAYVILISKIKINGSVVIFEEPCSDIVLMFFSTNYEGISCFCRKIMEEEGSLCGPKIINFSVKMT